MKLRDKIWILLFLVFIISVMLTYLGSKLFIERMFLTLENSHVNDELLRINDALTENKNSLISFTSDWSHWNDLYDYMSGSNPSFVANNLVPTAFTISTINLISYWDKNAKLVIGGAMDTIKNQYVAYPAGITRYIYQGSKLLTSKTSIDGFLLLDDGVAMVASSLIRDSNDLKPAIGRSIMLRYITQPIITKIEDATHLKLEFLLPSAISNNLRLKPYYDILSINNNYAHPLNDKLIEGFTILRDINKKPIGMFRIQEPRTIYLLGKRAINYFLESLIALTICVLIITIIFMKKVIVDRLEQLNFSLQKISKNDSFVERVDEVGNDELSSLSKQINKLLTIINISHERLEKRVRDRTHTLQTINKRLEQEIVERKAIERELRVHKDYLSSLAHFDALTGLPNRIYFNEIFSHTIVEAKKDKSKFAVLFLDLDRFKTVNDALGHEVGDKVLKRIAETFKYILSANDIVARLSGDEFIFLIKNTTREYTQEMAAKIMKLFERPIYINDQELYINASIGICIFPDDGNTLEELQKNADLAMYKMKQEGGGNFRYFDKQLVDDSHRFIEMETNLRNALKNHEFQIYYQPQFETQTGKIIGAEALIRWFHPKHGVINPDIFIPQAEKSGFIMTLGEWLFREVCKKVKAWEDHGYPTVPIAVNISTKQFQNKNLAELISSILDETKLDAKHIEVEITESAMMEDVSKVTHKLENIRMLGIKICIDDFGSGFTSINYLKQFPISILKIDQAFVKGIPENQNDLAITKSIIDLAHSLNMVVIAEGVENPNQLQYLTNFGCDVVQGFYLSRPVSEQDFLAMLVPTAITY